MIKFLCLFIFFICASGQIVTNTCPNGCSSQTEVNATINGEGIVAIYNFTLNCPITSFIIPLPNCTNLYGFSAGCVLPTSTRVSSPGCTTSWNSTEFYRVDLNTTNPNCASSLILVWDAYVTLNLSISYVTGPIFINYGSSTCTNCTTLVPLACVPLPANFTTGPVTTSIPTTSQPTTGILTTGIPTTSIPTTSIPTTSIPTTSIPTTAIPTTSIPTTGIITTSIPTTAIPTTSIPTTAIHTTGMRTTIHTTIHTTVHTSTNPHTSASTNMPITTGRLVQAEDKSVISILVIGIMMSQLVLITFVILICLPFCRHIVRSIL